MINHKVKYKKLEFIYCSNNTVDNIYNYLHILHFYNNMSIEFTVSKTSKVPYT